MIKNSTELCAHCENLPVSKTDCFAVSGACVVSAKCSNAQQMDAVRNVSGQASASAHLGHQSSLQHFQKAFFEVFTNFMGAKVLTVHCWTFVVSFSPPLSLPPCWNLARSEWPSTASAPRGLKGKERVRKEAIERWRDRVELWVELTKAKKILKARNGKCLETSGAYSGLWQERWLCLQCLSFPSGWLKLQDDPSPWIYEVHIVKKRYNLWFQ